jgi:hypothetical protein
MNDLTCVFLTMNKVPWMKYHNKKMLEAIGSYPLITISRELMDLPGTHLYQDEEQSHDKIFKLVMEGAKAAKTPYIAVVEDDMLYSKDHFELRPPLDTFGYNWNRWSLFTFTEPMFSFKRRYCNGCSILPRDLVIEAMEERVAKWGKIPHYLNGELGYEKVERNLGVTVRKSMVLYSKTPVVQIHHTYGTPGIGRRKPEAKDTIDLEVRKTRKRHGMMRAYNIPYWGEAKELIKHFV